MSRAPPARSLTVASDVASPSPLESVMTRHDSTSKKSVQPGLERLAEHQLDGRVGGVEGPAAQLEVLDLGEHGGDDLGPVGQVEAGLAGLELDARPPRHVADEGAHAVADEGRVHVLVEVGVDLERARVQARLVREGAGADIGLPAVGGDVGDLADRVRDVHGPREGVGRHDVEAELELEVGGDRG